MEVFHRIALTADSADQLALEAIGISIATGTTSFEIGETSVLWPEVSVWVAQRRPSDFVSTTFSKSEADAAAWLALQPEWHHGYPQPREEEFGYRQATYDLSEYCEECGTGLRQIAPFQMKHEPQWGRRGILQLNWVFDEYFVKPDVWLTVLEPLGIGKKPVRDTRGAELQSVVQLDVAATVGIATAGLPHEQCGRCGRVKYLPVTRGPLPALESSPAHHVAKTIEYFGSGANAFHEVLVSQDLRRTLNDHAVRGAGFIPVSD